jgi:hypothetical protein
MRQIQPTNKEIEEYMAGFNMGSPVLPDTIPSANYDIISKPKHYMLFAWDELPIGGEGIEVRDVIAKLVQKLYIHSGSMFEDKDNPLFESDYVQLMQYLMRFMDKNGVEDLKKARWYLDKMISAY